MSQKLIKSFREKISREPVLGFFSKVTDPALVECMGNAGLDFVILDMEHGPHDVMTLQNHVRAAETAGILPIVRTREEEPTLLTPSKLRS